MILWEYRGAPRENFSKFFWDRGSGILHFVIHVNFRAASYYINKRYTPVERPYRSWDCIPSAYSSHSLSHTLYRPQLERFLKKKSYLCEEISNLSVVFIINSNEVNG